MGNVYKRKKRSCALCKPHKMGGADKMTNRQRFLKNQSQEEIDEGVAAFEDPTYHYMDDYLIYEGIMSERDHNQQWGLVLFADE